jgi:hypothetical protein
MQLDEATKHAAGGRVASPDPALPGSAARARGVPPGGARGSRAASRLRAEPQHRVRRSPITSRAIPRRAAALVRPRPRRRTRAVARRRRAAAGGLIGPIPDAVVIDGAARCGRLARAHDAAAPNRVLNACRAWRWLETRRWSSKTEAAEWAIDGRWRRGADPAGAGTPSRRDQPIAAPREGRVVRGRGRGAPARVLVAEVALRQRDWRHGGAARQRRSSAVGGHVRLASQRRCARCAAAEPVRLASGRRPGRRRPFPGSSASPTGAAAGDRSTPRARAAGTDVREPSTSDLSRAATCC